MNDFHTTLIKAGYKPPHTSIDNSSFLRFGPKLAHWMINKGDYGAAGDWRGELPRVRWHVSGRENITIQEKEKLRLETKAAFEAYQNDNRAREQEAAELALDVWKNASEAGTSPYLERKQVPAIGIRFSKDSKTGKPFIAIPLLDDENRLCSIQKIYADGTKLFLKGGRKHGCFYTIGNISSSHTVYFCEGYATAASVYLATEQATVTCFDAGNVEPVIASVQRNYPHKRLVIAADNDAYGSTNTGKEKAEYAAQKYGCLVAIPTFKNTATKPTDFNDLHVSEGLGMVREQLNKNYAPLNSKANTEWPEPDFSFIETEHSSPCSFDDDCLPPVWMAWIKEQAQALGCPVDYVVAAFISSASAIIGNARRVAATPDWVEPPHLWFAAIGAPSTGKTPAQKPFIEVCKVLEREDRPAWEENLIEHDEQIELAKAKIEKWKLDIKSALKKETPPPDRPTDAVLPDAPIMPRIVINDSTIEEATNILSGNPKGLLLIRDELSGWIGSFDRYGGEGSDRAFYLECWNGGSHTVDRVKKSGQPIEVSYASLSILGGIQPDKLRETFSGADDGFAARFIYVWPAPVPFRSLDSLRSDDNGMRAHFLLTAFQRLHGLKMGQSIDGDFKPKTIPLESTALFDDIRREAMEKARTTQGLAAGWHGKNPARALRLALIIEYLSWAASTDQAEPSIISNASMAYAGTFIDYAGKMFEQAICGLAITQPEADAALVAKYIHENNLKQLNERELYQTTGFAHLRLNQRRKEAFTCLERMGWIKQANKENKGRRRADWLINPKLGDKL